MGLTDAGFVALTVALAVGFFVAVVAWTPRLTGHWARVLARGGLALGLVASSLLSAGAYLNAGNGWYSSWSELFGESDQAAVDVQGSQAKAAAAAKVAGGGVGSVAKPSQLPALPSPGSRKQEFTYRGSASGLTGKILVYLPASYVAAGGPQRDYPVIEALHGTPGSPSGWQTGLALNEQLDAAVSAGKLAETIVVMPQVNIPASKDWECVNGPGSAPQLETWLAKDVPAFIVEHLRVRTERAAWAAMGYSAGAWCAGMAGVLHPDVFGGVVMLSGYFSPDFADAPPWPAGSAPAKRYDLAAAVAASPPPLAMWVQTGKQSPYWKGTQAFLAAAKPPLSVTTVVGNDTGHRWDVWKANLPGGLAWLGANVPGFAPA